MGLFFNLGNLEKEAANDPIKFLAVLEYHYRGSIPSSAKSKYKPSKLPLKGYSFILNPEPIFNIHNIDINYLVQYIKLAGMRDWALYKTHKLITLDISFFPDLNLAKIKSNPILNVLNKQILFKYEELYNGTSFQFNQG